MQNQKKEEGEGNNRYQLAFRFEVQFLRTAPSLAHRCLKEAFMEVKSGYGKNSVYVFQHNNIHH